MKNALIPTYRPLPVRFVRGQGAYLWDEDDKKYLDALSGIAVTNLGHAHPTLTSAMQDQVSKLLHTSNAVEIPYQQELAKKLTTMSGMEQAFFCSSGAEANECAIKIARLYGHSKDIEVPTLIVMDKSFHGRSLATLTASGSRKVQAGFEPLVQGFVRAPFNDLKAIETIAANAPNVVALMVEPIQGEGGIHVPDPNYLTKIRELCNKNDWLFILDEIQTGMGRTGSLFNFQQTNIKPDVLTSAKALGNGLPIGACLVRGKAQGLMGVGQHGTTFGGNPFCSRIAGLVLDVIEQEKLTENAKTMGHFILSHLTEALQHTPSVKAVRGQGLMIGIELDKPCRSLLAKGLEQGILFNVTGADHVVRLLPPLIINQEQALQIVTSVTQIIKEFET